jgi:hypothetical protein
VLQTEVFSGWKDIAAYLGKGVRTVQRYERELNLPVRRPAGKSVGAVIATKAELDGWITAAPLHKVFQLSRAGTTAIDTRASLDELHRQVAEMHRLRQESAALRSQLHEAAELLRKNLDSSFSERPDRADDCTSPQRKFNDSRLTV